MVQLAEEILGGTKNRLELWEEHLKDLFVALENALNCMENPYLSWPLVRSFSWQVVWVAMACSCVGTKILQKMWTGPFWEGVWPCLDPWDSVRLRTASTFWNALAKSSSSLIRRSQWWFGATCQPFVSAETQMACALIGLQLFAAEGGAASSGGQSPELGNMWRQGRPKSPEWVGSCSASETSLGRDMYEHNDECRAIEVVGEDWSSDVALFVEDWELGRVALSCHMTMDLLCQEMRDACWDSSESQGSPCSLCSPKQTRFSCGRVKGMGAWKVNCHSEQEPFSHRGRAVTIKERDVARENREKEGV